jgi:hypothetical protein
MVKTLTAKALADSLSAFRVHTDGVGSRPELLDSAVDSLTILGPEVPVSPPRVMTTTPANCLLRLSFSILHDLAVTPKRICH